MSSVKSTRVDEVALPSSRTTAIGRLADYLELTKPRIAVMALFTVAVGYYLASAGVWHVGRLLHALFGIALVAAASSALNQYIERKTDACMERTSNRPIPGGRLLPREVLLFALSAGVIGCLYLSLAVNWTTAALAAVTLLVYAAVYTPLKRYTALCTAVGAVAGALPPVLGWTAAAGRLELGSLVLFGIMFLWQFPHFVAIGWLYRDDYERAGLKMLPTAASSPRVTGLLCVGYALALVPMSLLAARAGLAGEGFFIAATILGAGYVASAVRFMLDETRRTARGVIYASLVYLPLLLLLLTWDHYRLLQ